MLNFEKSIDKIVELIQKNCRCEDFLHLTNTRYNQVSCEECGNILKEWLLSEYREPEIDWANVPIDTPILVWDCDEDDKRRYYFAAFLDGKIYAWKNGATSWSAKGQIDWEHAELANVEGE